MIIVFIIHLFLCLINCKEILHPHAVPIHESDEASDIVQDDSKRGLIPKLHSDFTYLPSEEEKKKNMILYYSFENQNAGSPKIKDESGFDNNGMIGVGGMILEVPGSTCHDAAYLWDQAIRVTFNTPDGAPKLGFSISMWIKILVIEGEHILFQSRGKRFGVMTLKFSGKRLIFEYLECINCSPHFIVAAETNLTHNWFHVVATYNALTGIAQIYMDGLTLNRTYNHNVGPLRYWGNDVRIGSSRGKPLKGFVDDVRIYNYDLSPQEVGFLSVSCCFTGRCSMPHPGYHGPPNVAPAFPRPIEFSANQRPAPMIASSNQGPANLAQELTAPPQTASGNRKPMSMASGKRRPNMAPGYQRPPPNMAPGYQRPPPNMAPGYQRPPPNMAPGYQRPPPNMAPGYQKPPPNMAPGYQRPPPNMAPGYQRPPNMAPGYQRPPNSPGNSGGSVIRRPYIDGGAAGGVLYPPGTFDDTEFGTPPNGQGIPEFVYPPDFVDYSDMAPPYLDGSSRPQPQSPVYFDYPGIIPPPHLSGNTQPQQPTYFDYPGIVPPPHLSGNTQPQPPVYFDYPGKVPPPHLSGNMQPSPPVYFDYPGNIGPPYIDGRTQPQPNRAESRMAPGYRRHTGEETDDNDNDGIDRK